MIEHLIASRMSRSGDPPNGVEIGRVEVAHAPRQDLALTPEPLEGGDRLFQPVRAPPVQEITVQSVGAEAHERSLARRKGPAEEALCGRTLETRKTSSRRPASAAPTNSSAAPEPYSSAVSTWVMPKSRPRRKADIAVAESASSIYQVPWPITGASRIVEPNVRRSMGHFPLLAKSGERLPRAPLLLIPLHQATRALVDKAQSSELHEARRGQSMTA